MTAKMTVNMTDKPASEASKLSADAQARVARRRSIAIALMLAVMVVVFYATTLIRFGGAIATKGGAL